MTYFKPSHRYSQEACLTVFVICMHIRKIDSCMWHHHATAFLVSAVFFLFCCIFLGAYCMPTCGFSGSTCFETTSAQSAPHISFTPNRLSHPWELFFSKKETHLGSHHYFVIIITVIYFTFFVFVNGSVILTYRPITCIKHELQNV